MNAADSHAAEQRARAAERESVVAKSKHDVLEATINAADLYLQALHLSDNAADRTRLDSKCKELLTKAESIKRKETISENGEKPLPSTGPLPVSLNQPKSKRKLTTREEIILLEGSKLNGFIFPPWQGDPAPEEFALIEGHDPFVDSPSLQLSPLQLETFAGWKRPVEAFAKIKIYQDGVELPTQPTMRKMQKIDLVQDMTADCSVVASLCAGSARAERGHSKVR